MSATYEREFKGILGGDPKTLESVIKTLPEDERTHYLSAQGRPFLVVRAAGSLGADLVAVRDDLSFLVEVKSTKNDTFYFSDSGRYAEQFSEIRTQCERSGVLPIYALRRKGVRGDAWRLYTMPGMSLNSGAGPVWERLPKIAKTVGANDILRWKDGMPLATFLGIVCNGGSATHG